ncbi:MULTISPECIES: glycine betaine ABC transporter substrate-binding protein [Halorhodospira]|uniref:glycine betaine ABC transporter substrate-binding protein n=1 Tax=Halorhodospira TaxID=85108 RepID=UPI001912BE9B|nr:MULTISPECIES: glycine betaine ABC transporter substrate-binding protein [Halorhodospira]MBK5937207.1 glycine/betaine ABC transporter substrate-binding protein [Halorhodospira halophila]MBK5942597.1 glycine/betaine ABC transporter substrate-binding protein [Halorhodospira halophila]MCG5529023.1 glycine betaine ABC transporter substrate-binding protein [Halorhodospira halophila]MCG5540300.1 glycine betaine ABC transporter substrate-binding protein [Halorhodospira sp. M39old]MCG5544121.1 glyci
MAHSWLRTAGAALLIAPLAATAGQEIRIGWTAWADAEFVTRIAERLLEERYDVDVELVQTDIAPQYTGIARGDLDLMLMSWQPITHEDYIERYSDDLLDLGVLYGDARLGWVVPRWLYEDGLTSIDQLNEERWQDALDGTIQGIDPGAGLMRLSHEAIETYGLDYTLIEASDAGMTASLDRAARRDEPIVVTGWSPHWKFGAYQLAFLDDPRGALGGAETIHALARLGFDEDHPQIAAFIGCMDYDLEMLNDYLFIGRDESTEAAVDRFFEQETELISAWAACATEQ